VGTGSGMTGTSGSGSGSVSVTVSGSSGVVSEPSPELAGVDAADSSEEPPPDLLHDTVRRDSSNMSEINLFMYLPWCCKRPSWLLDEMILAETNLVLNPGKIVPSHGIPHSLNIHPIKNPALGGVFFIRILDFVFAVDSAVGFAVAAAGSHPDDDRSD